jgi:hypothetical protein
MWVAPQREPALAERAKTRGSPLFGTDRPRGIDEFE